MTKIEKKTTFHPAGPESKVPAKTQKLAENVGNLAERVLSEKKVPHPSTLPGRVQDKTHSPD